MSSNVVYRARLIRTLDPMRPTATHVAVKDGVITAVGGAADMPADAAVDERFGDQVLTPGFVEGHTHMDGATAWDRTYVGIHDRYDPDGRLWPGVDTIDGVIARLGAQADRDADKAVMGWGFDPLLLGHPLSRRDLDTVASDRPVAVLHASGHILALNTEGLKRAGLFPPQVPHPGLPVGEDGLPSGEVQGGALMAPAARALGVLDALMGAGAKGAQAFSKMCVRVGVTTATDLASPLSPGLLAALEAATAASDFPTRIVAVLYGNMTSPEPLIARALELKARSSDRLRLGAIKLVLDGSIQGFTARLLAGGYHNGRPNGLWYLPPEQLSAVYDGAMRAGLQVHTHTNGDEATELALERIAVALEAHPDPDHRFMLQHVQLANPAQMQRAAAMGVGMNLFANHIWFWGETHAAHTVGESRAATMNAARSALDLGVSLALHSDDPVTPMSPLFTAWCAINRVTGTGRVLGPDQRITPQEALEAITLGGARSLKLESEIGSIEIGKRADFAVLGEDPLTVDPMNLKDIPVWGVVLGGRPASASV